MTLWLNIGDVLIYFLVPNTYNDKYHVNYFYQVFIYLAKFSHPLYVGGISKISPATHIIIFKITATVVYYNIIITMDTIATVVHYCYCVCKIYLLYNAMSYRYFLVLQHDTWRVHAWSTWLVSPPRIDCDEKGWRGYFFEWFVHCVATSVV